MLAGAAAVAGDHDRAHQIARLIADGYARAEVLTALVGAVVTVGDHARARQAAVDAETIVRSITGDPDWQAWAFTTLVGALAVIGDYDRALRLAADAERLAWSITDRDRRSEALARLAGAATAASDHDQAQQIARSIGDPFRRAEVLTKLIGAVAAVGDYDRVQRLAADAEQIARSITSAPDWEAPGALIKIVRVVAAAGDHDRAQQIAQSITNPYTQAVALTAVAKAVGLPHGCLLLGKAFAVGTWWVPLPVVARMMPHVVMRVADAVSDIGPSLA